MFFSNDRLASVAKFAMIPDRASKKPLHGAGGDWLPQGDRLDIFSVGATEQASDVGSQQSSALLSREAIGQQREELTEQTGQFCESLGRSWGRPCVVSA